MGNLKISFCRSLSVFGWLIFNALVLQAQSGLIENKGQWLPEVLYKADFSGGSAWFEKGLVKYCFSSIEDLRKMHPATGDKILHKHAVFVRFSDCNKQAPVTSIKPSEQYYNYFIGNDFTKWTSEVRAYQEITYHEIYKGIDVEINSAKNALKFTWKVAAGADASAIKMRYEGAEKLSIKDGKLFIKTSVNEVSETKPVAWQFDGKKTIPVLCNYYLIGDEVTFMFPKGYNHNLELVIDPILIFATYSGSTEDNWGFTATYDKQGNAYAGGTVYGDGLPQLAGSFQQTWNGGYTTYPPGNNGDIARDVALYKYNPDGSKMIWASYLGGTYFNEQPHSMVVDEAGNLIVIGTTLSTDFPVTSGAYDTKFNDTDVVRVTNPYPKHIEKGDLFVSKISSDGKQLIASTFLGGSASDGFNGHFVGNTEANAFITGYNYGDMFRGEVVTDLSNNIYVASSSRSADFPITSGAAQDKFGGKQDGIVVKFNPSLSGILFSTYVGGSDIDAAYSLKVDTAGGVYVCGGTLSSDLFATSSGYQKNYGGNVDGYLAHIDKDGKSFLNHTFTGKSSYDQTYFVQMDKAENVYVYGQTNSADFPIFNVKYSNPKSGQFIVKYNHNLDNMIYSTRFGRGDGNVDISPTAFLVDYCERIYISGWGGAVNRIYPDKLGHGGSTYGLPVTGDAFQSKTKDTSDFYIAVFSRNIDTLIYASFFGGDTSHEHVDGGTSRFDKNAIIYQSVCGGCGGNSDFPVTYKAWSKTNNSSNCNNLVFKVDLDVEQLIADFNLPPFGCAPFKVTFDNQSEGAKSYFWTFGDGDTAYIRNPTHEYKDTGTYNVTLVVYNPFSCNLTDTFRRKIELYKEAIPLIDFSVDNCGQNVFLTSTRSKGNSFKWNLGDGTTSTKQILFHHYKTPGKHTITLLVDSGTLCEKISVSKDIYTHYRTPDFKFEVCDRTVKYVNNSTDADTFLWYFGDGDSSLNKTPTHTYKQNGTYKVTLWVNPEDSCNDSLSLFVTVPDKPNAEFTWKADSCNETITLNNTSTKSATYLWKFDDGTTDTAAVPKPKQLKYGTKHKVILIANPENLCADTFIDTVETIRAPDAGFSFKKDSCTKAVLFKDTSYRAHSYQWNFGDGTTGKLRNPIHQYSKPGTYTVTLKINDTSDCNDSFTTSVTINPDDVNNIFIPNVFTPNGDNINDGFGVSGFNRNCEDYTLYVFNRWGQQLAELHKQNPIWNGTNDVGLALPGGTYFWLFEYGKSQMAGSVTLIR